MYYHLNDHIYVTRFRDEFIVLDTKKDKYTIYLKQLLGHRRLNLTRLELG